MQSRSRSNEAKEGRAISEERSLFIYCHHSLQPDICLNPKITKELSLIPRFLRAVLQGHDIASFA